MTLGIIAATASLAGVFVGVTPAQAISPYFEIFYSPDCGAKDPYKGSASRIYYGANSGEAWINDTFNHKGPNGLGQKIAYNAASVFVYRLSLTINYDQNLWWGVNSAGACFNFTEPYRNKNRNWMAHPF